MKTAMQELIDRLEEHLVQSAKGQLLTKRGGDYRIGLRKAIDFANKFLEQEKSQIENSFDTGRDETTMKFIEDGEDYYNQTYNQDRSQIDPRVYNHKERRGEGKPV